MTGSDLYWQRRLGELERRIEKLEAETAAIKRAPTNNSDYYSVEEMATALGVNRVTVVRKIQDGTIQAYKVGRRWKIPKSELEKIFE